MFPVLQWHCNLLNSNHTWHTSQCGSDNMKQEIREKERHSINTWILYGSVWIVSIWHLLWSGAQWAFKEQGANSSGATAHRSPSFCDKRNPFRTIYIYLYIFTFFLFPRCHLTNEGKEKSPNWEVINRRTSVQICCVPSKSAIWPESLHELKHIHIHLVLVRRYKSLKRVSHLQNSIWIWLDL